MIFSAIIIFLISSFILSAPSGTDIELTHLFTISGSDSLLLSDISDAAITKNGEVVLLSYGQNQAMVFDSTGGFLFSMGREGRGPGEFSGPGSITVGPNGYVYIEDRRNARISIWDSVFEYITDISVMPGWNTHLKTNNHTVYVFSKPHRRTANGNSVVEISEVDTEKKTLHDLLTYEINYRKENRALTTWSNWDISDDMRIVYSGDIKSSVIRIVNTDGDILNTFGKKYELVFFTEEEVQARVEAAGRISPQFAAIRAEGREFKHMFTNIEIDERGNIWVHRNKKFGSLDEIDIYTLEGKLKETVTFPPSKDTYHMLGIYGDIILFRVTDLYERQELIGYEIEYSE